MTLIRKAETASSFSPSVFGDRNVEVEILAEKLAEIEIVCEAVRPHKPPALVSSPISPVLCETSNVDADIEIIAEMVRPEVRIVCEIVQRLKAPAWAPYSPESPSSSPLPSDDESEDEDEDEVQIVALKVRPEVRIVCEVVQRLKAPAWAPDSPESPSPSDDESEEEDEDEVRIVCEVV